MAIDVAELTDEQLRQQVDTWLRENLPAEWVAAVESGDQAKLAEIRRTTGMAMYGFGGGGGEAFGLNVQDYLDKLAESGYACPTWPKGYCGLGVSPVQARIVGEELGKYLSPRPFNIIGIGMGGPTLIQWGTEEQKQKLLKPMVANREIWCQLFSEPGHGSDAAGLSTRAVRAGDEWIVNGQKVWTTFAHLSKWGMLVARTNVDVPKHQGLSYFIVDMKAPGVTVRPLKQITGDAEFNEVFFEDVRIPDSMRVSEEGMGWQVATTTLMNERVALGSGTTGGMPESIGKGPVDGLIEQYRPVADEAVRDELMKLWVESAVIRLTGARAGMRRKTGAQPGPEGSIGKLAGAEFNKKLGEMHLALEGAGGAAWAADDRLRDGAVRSFLRSRANTIEGGTSEIMRNILGERVLGLPKDIDVSRDVAWKDVPRSGGR